MKKCFLSGKIKIAAFDIDGTLLPYAQPAFSDNVTLMFKELKKSRIKTVLSSAREFISIGNLMEQTPDLDYFIGANGMFVYDVQKEKIIYEKPISFEDMKIIYDEFSNSKNCNGFMIMDRNYGFLSKNMNRDTWFLKPHKIKLKNMDLDLIEKDHLHIITIACENDEQTDLCIEQAKKLIEKHNLNLEVNSKWHRGFFLTPKGVNKFTALDWLCDYLGYKSKENLITFGDSSNDYEMIKEAAYGVAMEEASELIKSAAKDIALSAKKDGAYYKLVELCLIKT